MGSSTPRRAWPTGACHGRRRSGPCVDKAVGWLVGACCDSSRLAVAGRAGTPRLTGGDTTEGGGAVGGGGVDGGASSSVPLERNQPTRRRSCGKTSAAESRANILESWGESWRDDSRVPAVDGGKACPAWGCRHKNDSPNDSGGLAAGTGAM